MKRPMLVTGITAVILCILLTSFEIASIALPVLAVSVLILYSIKKLGLRKHIVIPAICIITLFCTLSFFGYNKTKLSPYMQYHNSCETICAKVITTPTVTEDKTRFVIKADKIGAKDADVKINVLLQGDFSDSVKLFDYVTLPEAYITAPTSNSADYNLQENSDDIFFNATDISCNVLWQCGKTPYYYCLKLKEIISSTIDLYMDTNQGGLLKGMLFGDKASMDNSVTQSFRNSGISHLLAVSGLHTSLWCGLLISLLSAFKIPEKARNIICLAFLVLFCIISGFTPSVMRASFMMAIILSAPLFKRMPDGLNSLGVAVTLILLMNPYTVSSISFQLSATATLGVILANNYNEKIATIIKEIPITPIKRILNSLLSSLLISCFAGLFTLPVSAQYFGVLSLVAPISNILCVQLSFYGMIGGIISVASSFINIPFIKNVCIFLFEITQFILDIVIALSGKISEYKFSTIPIHKDFFNIALGIIFVVCVLGYFLYKSKEKKYIITLSATVTSVVLIASVLFPIFSPTHKNSITISNAGNNIQLVIRSGLQYAYLENSSSLITSDTYNALPKATSEALTAYISTYLTKDSVNNLTVIGDGYTPKETIISAGVYKLAKSFKTKAPQNTTISNSGKITLSDEITLEIVDTSSIKYAIIRSNEKTVYVHLYGDTDFSKYISVEEYDVFVFNTIIPEIIPQNAETVILSADSNYDLIKAKKLKDKCRKLHITGKDGSASFYI